MTARTESNQPRDRASSKGDDARKELRRFFAFGPEADDRGPGADLLPPQLTAFRGAARVRTDYPLYLGPRHLEGSLGGAATGTGALCLGFEELVARILRTLEGEGSKLGPILSDNLRRLEGHVLDLLADDWAAGADARQTLAAAGAAMAEALVRESGLSGADREALERDVARMAGALPPAPQGRARLVGPRRGLALTLLGHALVDGRGTTRDTFLHEGRELAAKGRALLESDRRKSPEVRKAEAAGGAMGEMGKRFVDPSALASVLGEHRGSEAMSGERRERLEQAVAALEAVVERVASPEIRLFHDGTLPWLDRALEVDGRPWQVEESSDPCAAAAEAFDRAAERLAEALRARERLELETSGEYEAARHEPWLERLAGLDWRAFAAGEAALIEPVVALESAAALADRGMVSLSKLLRSGRPVQVLVDVDPAVDPGAGADAGPGGEARFEPAYLGISHREAFVQQSCESRPLHLMEGFLRAASSSRTGLHVVAPWPEAREDEPPAYTKEQAVAGGKKASPTGREGAPSPPPRGEERVGERRGDQLPPALLAGAAIDGRAHPLFRYDPETGPSWAHRLDFGGNAEPAADWVTGEGGPAAELPFTFADFALLVPGLRRHLRPATGASDEDLVPLAEWLDLDADEALHQIPTVTAADAGGRSVPLAVSRSLALECRDRLGFWRTLQELAGVKSEYVRRAAEAVRSELEEAARDERERLEAAHAAELERVRERASREAVDRLTSALLDVDLGLFAEPAPAVPSFVGKTVDEVAESLLASVGGLDDDALEAVAGDGSPGSGGAVSEAAERLLSLIDTPDLDRVLEESQETTE